MAMMLGLMDKVATRKRVAKAGKKRLVNQSVVSFKDSRTLEFRFSLFDS